MTDEMPNKTPGEPMTDPAAARSGAAPQQEKGEMHEDDPSRVGPSVPCVDGQDLPQSDARVQSPMFKKATHSYVGSLPCGCGVAITLDVVEDRRGTAKSVSDMIRSGYVVQRYEHHRAVEVFCSHCAQYPHEPWQKRNEGVAKGQVELPLSVDAVGQRGSDPI